MTKVATTLFCLTFAVFVGAPGAYCSEEKSVAEWIEVIQKEEAVDRKLEATDPEFASIRLGAGIATGNHSGKLDHHIKQTTPIRREAFRRFVSFMESEGESMLCAWRRGEALSAKSRKYRTALQSVYLDAGQWLNRPDAAKGRGYVFVVPDDLKEDCSSFLDRVVREGQAALVKGYKTGRLNKGDVEALRLYRVQLGTTCVAMGYLPVDLKITPDPYGLTMGEEPPDDVEFFRLEALLKRPTYSDHADYDRYATYCLRPEGVCELLRLIPGYRWVADGRGGGCCRPVAPDVATNDPERTTLKSLVRDRPVLLYTAGSRDSFIPSTFPWLEYLRQAYGQEMDVYFVSTFCHDWLMSPADHFDRSKTSGKGMEGTGRSLCGHPFHIEDRARTTKNLCMRFPAVSVPCLVEPLTETFRNMTLASIFSQNNYLLLDRDGRVVDAGQTWGATTLHLNAMELAIHKLLKNDRRIADRDGRFIVFSKGPAKDPTTQRTGYIVCNTPRSPYVIQVEGTIKDLRVDRGEFILAASPAIAEKNAAGQDAAKEYLVKLSQQSAIARNGRPVALRDLHEGDDVVCAFRAEVYLGGEITEKQTSTAFTRNGLQGDFALTGKMGTIQTLRKHNTRRHCEHYLVAGTGPDVFAAIWVRSGQPANEGALVLGGKVLSVDPQINRICFQLVLGAEEDLLGYRFIQAAGAKAVLFDEAESYTIFMRRTLAKPESDRVFRAIVDDGVEVFLNGRFSASIDDLKPGDTVVLQCGESQWHSDAPLYPSQLRAVRLPFDNLHDPVRKP